MKRNFDEISPSSTSNSSQEEDVFSTSSSFWSELLNDNSQENITVGDLYYKKRTKGPLQYFQQSKYLKPSFPRIVKSDIRRKFPIMLTNVFNSFNMKLVRSFLTTFCDHQDILYQHIVNIPFLQEQQLQPAAHVFEISILHHVINFMGGMQEFTPDMVFMLKNSQIQRRIDCEGSLIVLTMEAHGSRIYPIFPSILADCIQGNNYFQDLYLTKYKKLGHEAAVDSLIALERFLSNYNVSDPKSLHNCGIPLLKNPLKRTIQSRIILQLDEQHRIHRITSESSVTGPDLPASHSFQQL
jgi:hypothetical protein